MVIKERKQELRHKLIDAQAGIGDEMGRFSAETDITEIVKRTKAAVKGKGLIPKLAIFAVLATPPDTNALRNGAIEQIRKFPLSSLFSTSHHDHEGKVIHRSPAGSSLASEEEAAIEVQIAHLEEIRRGMTVSGGIEIVRQEIMAEHFVTEFDLSVICSSSPFVPQGHERTFSFGFARFFQGDMIGALYVLTPQLENSLRHVLKQYGHDVVKINSADMTQQDRTISSLFETMREELNQIFGQATVDDIDRVFLRKPGPYIRHQAAHGLLLDGEPFGRDAIYACWLIFRLCCLPLLPHWRTIEARHNELYGRA